LPARPAGKNRLFVEAKRLVDKIPVGQWRPDLDRIGHSEDVSISEQRVDKIIRDLGALVIRPTVALDR